MQDRFDNKNYVCSDWSQQNQMERKYSYGRHKANSRSKAKKNKIFCVPLNWRCNFFFYFPIASNIHVLCNFVFFFQFISHTHNLLLLLIKLFYSWIEFNRWLRCQILHYNLCMHTHYIYLEQKIIWIFSVFVSSLLIKCCSYMHKTLLCMNSNRLRTRAYSSHRLYISVFFCLSFFFLLIFRFMAGFLFVFHICLSSWPARTLWFQLNMHREI